MQRAAIGNWTWVAALILALPAYAQDDTVGVVPVDDGTAEDAPAEEAPMEEAPAYEEFAEEVPAEEPPAEEVAEAPAEEEPAAEEEEPAEPLAVYLGADWVVTTLSLSTPGPTGANELDSGMYRGRVGMRALEAVGLEVQFGFDNSDDEPGSVELDSYYGLFVVPTATVFEMVELAFPVGYASSGYGQGDDLRSIAYGVDLELPLRMMGEELPDLRFTVGGMVYYQKTDARAYGVNAGLRYDFETTGIGNPVAGLGNVLGMLWPFGGDEEDAE